MPCPGPPGPANARTAAALPARQSGGPPGRPVHSPFSNSTGVTSTWSTPIARAAGSTWNRVADDASTTVCPARRCASTSRHASGYSEPAMPCNQQPLAELGELVLAAPGPGPHAQHEEPLEVVLGRHPAQADEQHPSDVGRRDVPGSQVVAGERAQRVPVDEGAVEVEERTDVRALRPGLDVGDQLLLGPDLPGTG